ncbi:MAG: threonine/serine dehydratase [Steroidobacteraceae bacterium]
MSAVQPPAADVPTLEQIQDNAARLAPYIVRTPVQPWSVERVPSALVPDFEVQLKLELWQHGGTFKTRGALSNMLGLTAEERLRGVTAMSAGNHAVAVAYAANRLGVPAKLVMQQTANPARRAAALSFGAEILIAADGPSGFALAEDIAAREGRRFIHPFDGKGVALGSGSLGLEWLAQCPDIEAIVVPVGGGGLAGGLSHAVRLAKPACEIYGVEPAGANVMQRSFQAGSAQRFERFSTIADSLAPPMTLELPYRLCRDNLSDLVTVDDDEICRALALLFASMQLAVEPAAATALAGVLGPLRKRLRGRKVAAIVCGTIIDPPTYLALLERGTAALASAVSK